MKWPTLSSIFFRPKLTADQSSLAMAEQLLEYLFGLVNREDLVAAERLEFNRLKRLSSQARESRYPALYLSVEGFILRNVPLVVRRAYASKNELRQEIAAHFPPDQLPQSLRLLFLPERQQLIELWKAWLEAYGRQFIFHFGLNRFNQSLQRLSAGTLLAGLKFSEGIDLGPVQPALEAADPADLRAAFEGVVRGLHAELLESLGPSVATSVPTELFARFKQRYDYDILSTLLMVAPPGVLAEERLTFSTRESLQQEVRRATFEEQRRRQQAEELSQRFQNQNKILEETKRAMLNLLEDLEEEKRGVERTVQERTLQLRDTLGRLETIMQSIGDGLFVVDLEGKVEFANRITQKMCEYTLEEMQGRHFSETLAFISDKTGEPNVAFVQEAIKSGQPVPMANHTSLVTRSGRRIPVSDSASPVVNPDGKTVGCVVVFHDTSRERSLERAKDEFVSIVAHQLRTPLGTSRWNLDMLRGGDFGKLPKGVKHVLDDIDLNNQRLIQLVDDLLNVSRIEQGRVVDKPEPVELVKLIEEIVGSLEHEAQQRKVVVAFRRPPKNHLSLTVDPQRLRQVMENILSNAIKYNRPGGLVSLTLQRTAGWIEIACQDTGLGIPEKDQGRIFSKFFRAENATISDTEGTGLGLFVVKSYVEAWGGSVNFSSVEGKGSRFVVLLPDEPKSLPQANP